MTITKQDAIFYLDMIDSVHTPDFRENRRKRLAVRDGEKEKTIRKYKEINNILRRKDNDKESKRKYERIIRVVTNYLDVLKTDEHNILCYRYGIGHEQHHTHKQIADVMGFSTSWISASISISEAKIAKQIKHDFDL